VLRSISSSGESLLLSDCESRRRPTDGSDM
jgi:hypothetical protein